jgi:hypothetical protein
LVELAKSRSVAVINSPYDTATTTMRIKSLMAILSNTSDEYASIITAT